MYQSLLDVCTVRIKIIPLKFLSPAGFVLLAIMLLSAISFNARAQNFFPIQTDYGIRAGVDYELPGKNLKDAYKAGLNYNAGFRKFFNDFTLEAVLSYREFKAKYPVQLDDTDPTSIGVGLTSPYRTYLIYISATYNVELTENVKLYGGLNLGGAYSYSYKDDNNDIYIGGGEKQGYLAPKLGFIFGLNDNWSLDLHGSYNLFTTGGDVTYNSRTGAVGQSINISTSISTGLGLIYKF